MKTLNPTKQLLVKMLTENTGKHFLDSGGDNGRMWQRNQGKNFESEPEVSAEFYESDDTPLITVSTYHYLSEILELDPFAIKVNSMFNRKRKKEGVNAHWVQDCAELLESWNEGPDRYSQVINTYNGENNLSQILLFITFVYDETAYVLLQIHGGADVRGGYTDTQCFKLKGYLTGLVEVYGSNDKGDEVSNTYNGYGLTLDNGDAIKMLENDNWTFNFQIYDETYPYLEN